MSYDNLVNCETCYSACCRLPRVIWIAQSEVVKFRKLYGTVHVKDHNFVAKNEAGECTSLNQITKASAHPGGPGSEKKGGCGMGKYKPTCCARLVVGGEECMKYRAAQRALYGISSLEDLGSSHKKSILDQIEKDKYGTII